MKKIIMIVVSALGIAAVAAAQPRAIGVRAGIYEELSYQHTLGANNFLEADLGWNFLSGSFSAAAAYDFNIAPVGLLNFYAGPAASLWSWANAEANSGGIGIGVGGQIGLEYIFEAIPLQLSIDWRPMFAILPATGFGWQSLALGIRYAF